MSRCPRCHENFPESAAVCPRCGAALRLPSGIWLGIRIIIAVLVSLVFLFLGGLGACGIAFSTGSPATQATFVLLLIVLLIVWAMILWALFRRKKKL